MPQCLKCKSPALPKSNHCSVHQPSGDPGMFASSENFNIGGDIDKYALTGGSAPLDHYFVLASVPFEKESFRLLARQFRDIRLELKMTADTLEDDVVVGHLAAAEAAVQVGNIESSWKYLSKTNRLTVETAKRIGVKEAAKIIGLVQAKPGTKTGFSR